MLTPQQLQNVRNLALLARQAISNGFKTMQVNPTVVADACVAFEAAVGAASPDTVSSAERIRGLEVELAAAKANVESLSRQIEQRYQDGLREGAAGAQAQPPTLGDRVTAQG